MNKAYIVKDSEGQIMGFYDTYEKAATRILLGNSGWYIVVWKK